MELADEPLSGWRSSSWASRSIPHGRQRFGFSNNGAVSSQSSGSHDSRKRKDEHGNEDNFDYEGSESGEALDFGEYSNKRRRRVVSNWETVSIDQVELEVLNSDDTNMSNSNMSNTNISNDSQSGASSKRSSKSKQYIHEYFSRRQRNTMIMEETAVDSGIHENAMMQETQSNCRCCSGLIIDECNRIICSYCQRPCCIVTCSADCQGCMESFCNFCTTINYDMPFERRICLDCNR
jgi:hypothetical protein